MQHNAKNINAIRHIMFRTIGNMLINIPIDISKMVNNAGIRFMFFILL